MTLIAVVECKLTQLTYGLLAPGNIRTNLATTAITSEVASHASNLLMDIKPGYMLGGKPRQQAVGHVLGVFAGAIAELLTRGLDTLKYSARYAALVGAVLGIVPETFLP